MQTKACSRSNRFFAPPSLKELSHSLDRFLRKPDASALIMLFAWIESPGQLSARHTQSREPSVSVAKLYHFTFTVRFWPTRSTNETSPCCLPYSWSSLVIFTSKQQYSAISRSRPSFHHFRSCKPSAIFGALSVDLATASSETRWPSVFSRSTIRSSVGVECKSSGV